MSVGEKRSRVIFTFYSKTTFFNSSEDVIVEGGVIGATVTDVRPGVIIPVSYILRTSQVRKHRQATYYEL